MQPKPILWSFRRCPYAMRARLAVQASGADVQLREILLRDKPAAFLATSMSGTVPCLDAGSVVIDESFDIMTWALQRSDPRGWLDQPDEAMGLIAQCDGSFKSALDRYKYFTRHPDGTREVAQLEAAKYLNDLDQRLAGQAWLFGKEGLSDMAILPFVRQFANTDRAWFDAQNWPHLIDWLNRFTESQAFLSIMQKYTPWQEGDDPVMFGQTPS